MKKKQSQLSGNNTNKNKISSNNKDISCNINKQKKTQQQLAGNNNNNKNKKHQQLSGNNNKNNNISSNINKNNKISSNNNDPSPTPNISLLRQQGMPQLIIDPSTSNNNNNNQFVPLFGAQLPKLKAPQLTPNPVLPSSLRRQQQQISTGPSMNEIYAAKSPSASLTPSATKHLPLKKSNKKNRLSPKKK